MRLLLLGATGFIGRHVAARAAAAGHEVVASRTVPSALSELAPGAVLNCAGATSGTVAQLVSGNVAVVGSLVAALAGTGIRLVHLGSAAEYGDQPPGPVREDATPCPVSPYGITKLAGTALVGAAGLNAVVLRVFNPVGPGSPPTSLPGRLAVELSSSSGTDLHLGPLTAYRDFVDVRDVADAMLAAATTDGPLPAVLNIGSGRAVRIRELADSLAAIAGGVHRIIAEDGKDGGVSWSQADIRAATRTLGWLPAFDLKTSLHDLWSSL